MLVCRGHASTGMRAVLAAGTAKFLCPIRCGEKTIAIRTLFLHEGLRLLGLTNQGKRRLEAVRLSEMLAAGLWGPAKIFFIFVIPTSVRKLDVGTSLNFIYGINDILMFLNSHLRNLVIKKSPAN